MQSGSCNFNHLEMTIKKVKTVIFEIVKKLKKWGLTTLRILMIFEDFYFIQIATD